jgi:hypothetical protein
MTSVALLLELVTLVSKLSSLLFPPPTSFKPQYHFISWTTSRAQPLPSQEMTRTTTLPPTLAVSALVHLSRSRRATRTCPLALPPASLRATMDSRLALAIPAMEREQTRQVEPLPADTNQRATKASVEALARQRLSPATADRSLKGVTSAFRSFLMCHFKVRRLILVGSQLVVGCQYYLRLDRLRVRARNRSRLCSSRFVSHFRKLENTGLKPNLWQASRQ